jgi:hypothetical protein
MISVQAHIGRLRDPSLLEPWLYTIARAECQRRAPTTRQDAVTVGDKSRLMAWNAVMSLPADEREALDLATRVPRRRFPPPVFHDRG